MPAGGAAASGGGRGRGAAPGGGGRGRGGRGGSGGSSAGGSNSSKGRMRDMALRSQSRARSTSRDAKALNRIASSKKAVSKQSAFKSRSERFKLIEDLKTQFDEGLKTPAQIGEQLAENDMYDRMANFAIHDMSFPDRVSAYFSNIVTSMGDSPAKKIAFSLLPGPMGIGIGLGALGKAATNGPSVGQMGQRGEKDARGGGGGPSMAYQDGGNQGQSYNLAGGSGDNLGGIMGDTGTADFLNQLKEDIGMGQISAKIGNQQFSFTPRAQRDELNILLTYLLEKEKIDQGAYQYSQTSAANEPSFIDKGSQMMGFGSDAIGLWQGISSLF